LNLAVIRGLPQVADPANPASSDNRRHPPRLVGPQPQPCLMP